MSTTTIAVADELANLEKSILALPRHGQTYLLEMLRLHLAADPEDDDPGELSPAWQAEIARRLRDLDEGRVQPIDGDEFLAKLASLYP
ncbi:MAG: addiction module protein [Fimbriimonadaceae bacterium]|nr:addiction module protein [Fimbriimonadaceae bacterium]